MRSSTPRIPILSAIALVLVAGGCAPDAPEAPEPRGDGVSLVVLLVVDQARADYLDRFRPLFDGGLAMLVDRGALFVDAHHEHAGTYTAPGHASLSTGLVPARHGVIGNEWFDRATRRVVSSVGAAGSPSPGYLIGSGLGDWMKERDPRSRVFSASAKARSAIMLGGQGPDGVYWYDSVGGGWYTSTHYTDTPPAWLQEFNARRWSSSLFGQRWQPLEGREIAAEFGLRAVDWGLYHREGPHALGGLSLEPDRSFHAAIYDSPFIDEYLAQLARTIVTSEGLGQDGSPDLLALSFAGLDSVGHDYGPDSAEVLDTLLRLDRSLGDLFAFLDQSVGLEHVLVALSSDHGVQPLPELRDEEGDDAIARRIRDDDVACVQRTGAAIEERLGAPGWYLAESHGFYLDHEALAAIGADPEEVTDLAARLLEECEAIRRVWTARELSGDGWSDDPDYARFRNSHYPSRSPDLTVQFEPYYLRQGAPGTTHGTVYDYDSHVPFVLMGAGVPSLRVSERVATVDLAPTLARLIGLDTVPAELDGRDRAGLLRAPE